MQRREFLTAGLVASAALACPAVGRWLRPPAGGVQQQSRLGPAWSVIPVVGDGYWIWREPPQDQTGYLEPRPYELKVGIELTGRGTAGRIMATTPAPVELPEQTVERVSVERHNCEAALRPLAAEAGQLLLAAPAIAKGQVLAAYASYRLTLHKQYHGLEQDQFPAEQNPPAEIRKQYLGDTPGIQTRAPEVRELAARLSQGRAHPWQQALAFHDWVWNHIGRQVGAYTSVVAALRDRKGDCEECAAVFVALCRASGIPARLVWVPNHNWAEFYLQDESGVGHWIPAHTSCYSWFGWTGAHELVLQKGDNIALPEKRRAERLVADWMQWQGARPAVRWLAELRPLPAEEGADPGPGARSKNEQGEWVVVPRHQLDPYLRDGSRLPAAAQRN